MSPGGDNEENFVLNISAEGTDQAAAQINSLDDALNGFLNDLTQISQSEDLAQNLPIPFDDAAASVSNLSDQLAALPLDELIDKNQQIAASYDAIAQSAQDAAGAAQDAGSSDTGGGDDSGGGIGLPSSRAFSSAGRLLGSQAGGQDVSAIGSVVRLTAAFGPFGAALGVGLAAVNAVTQAEAAHAKEAQDDADKLSAIAAGAAEGTTDSITKQIAVQQANQATLKDAQSQLTLYNDELKNLRANYDGVNVTSDEYNTNIKNLESEYDKITATTHDWGSKVLDFSGLLTDNQAAIDQSKTKVDGLNVELGTQAVKTNDAAAASQAAADAEQKLTDARNAEIKAADDRITQSQVTSGQNVVDAQGMTATQRASTISSLQAQQAALESYVQNNYLSAAATKQLNDQITDMSNHIVDLQGVSISYTDVIAQQTKDSQDQLKVVTDSIQYSQQLSEQIATSTVTQATDRLRGLQEENNALNEYLPELEKLAPTSQAAADALSQAQTRLGQLSDDYQDQITQVLPAAQKRALDEYQQAISDAQAKETQQATADYQDEQAKLSQLTADGAAKREQIIQDNTDAINKIETQFASDDFTAIANRDAVADDTARKKEATDLTNQQASSAKQLNQEQLTLTQQETAEQQSYNKQIQQLQTSLAQQDQTLTQKYQLDQSNLRTSLNNQLTIQTSMYQQMAVAAANGAAGVVRAFAAGISGVGAPVGGPGNNPNETPLNANQNNAANFVLQVLDGVLPSQGGGAGLFRG